LALYMFVMMLIWPVSMVALLFNYQLTIHEHVVKSDTGSTRRHWITLRKTPGSNLTP